MNSTNQYESKNIYSPEAAIYSFQDNGVQLVNFKNQKGLRGQTYNYQTKTHLVQYNQESFYYTPITSVQKVFINGSFIQYNIDNLQNALLSQFFVHIQIVNEDLVNALSLRSIPELIDQLVLLNAGTEITNTTRGPMIQYYNEFTDITEDNQTQLRQLRGLTPMGATYVTIAAGASKEFYFKIPLSISDNYILQQSLLEPIKIRLTYIANASQSLFANIYSHFVRCDSAQTQYILRQPYCDYTIIRPQEYQYTLNQLVNNTTYTVNLQSFHPESAWLLIYVNKQNGINKTERETLYSIQDVQILDSQNKNISNQVVYNKTFIQAEILRWFCQTPWFKQNLDKLVLFNFCLDPQLTLGQNQNVVGSHSFYGVDYKITFKADQTTPNQTNQLNIISWNYGLLRIAGGKLNQYINSNSISQ